MTGQINNQNMKKGMFPYFLLLVIGLSIMFFYSMTDGSNKELTYNEFNKALNKNNVEEVVITPSTAAYTYQITGKLKDAKKGETFTVKTPLSDTVIEKIVASSEEKDFKINEALIEVLIELTADEMKIGELIDKPRDYWYEIELNPDTPKTQTIIGYEKKEGIDYPAIMTLLPEGGDKK